MLGMVRWQTATAALLLMCFSSAALISSCEIQCSFFAEEMPSPHHGGVTAPGADTSLHSHHADPAIPTNVPESDWTLLKPGFTECNPAADMLVGISQPESKLNFASALLVSKLRLVELPSPRATAPRCNSRVSVRRSSLQLSLRI